MLSPWVAAAYSVGVNEWDSGSSGLTQLRRILERSQRCWWVSTMGNILESSLAAAAAARAVPAAERKSRRFIVVALGRSAGIVPRSGGGGKAKDVSPNTPAGRP